MTETRFYRLPEICAALRVSRTTAYRLIAKGALVPVHFGRCLRFRAAEIDRMIETGTGHPYPNDNEAPR